ncbi:hypothetical protein [Plantactinospora sp. B5E13]|uniref:hypothetical protein n=1 Tax=unclassified Plantactinospora TaxID=2631981 RepID=UPI00325CCB41
MLEWLTPLVSLAGPTLVNLATTEAWQSARGGLVRLFGRGGERRQAAAERWVSQTVAEIEQAPEERRAEVRERLAVAWQQRLTDLLDEYPEAAEELRVWVDQARTQLPATQQVQVNTFVARDSATQYNSPGGSITVTHHHDPARRTA